MTSEKLSTEIAVLERKSKEAKNATVKKLLDKKIATLREELKKEADAIGKLSKAKKKVREMTQDDFNEYIKMLSKKDGYSFLKSMTKDEIKRDIQRVAKPVGWRFRGNNAKKPTKKDVKEGNDVYFENRVNRSDVSRTVKLAKGGGVGQLPKSLQRRIDSLDGRLDITKEKALEAYRLHIDKGYGGSGVGYELFNAKNQKESKTFGDLAIDLGKFYSENKYAKGGGVGEYGDITLKYDYPKYKRKPAATVYMKVDTSSHVKVGGLGEKGYRLVFKDGNRSDSVITERELEQLVNGETINSSGATVTISDKYAEGGVVWEVNDVSKAKYLGVLEFQDNDGEYHNFEVMETDERLVFGGYTNSGFIESGYIEKDGNSTDETLQELLADLETYYNDGEKYTSSIVVNQRMATGGSVTDGDFGAEKAGQRRSRKYSTIEIKSGGEYTRRNANQYGKAKGGRNYTENRDNRSDKRRWMEDGGSVNEGLFGEPHRLEMAEKGMRVDTNWTGDKRKESWGKADLYKMYDNNLDLSADVHDYYKKLGSEISVDYADEMKKDLIEILKTGSLKGRSQKENIKFDKGGEIISTLSIKGNYVVTAFDSNKKTRQVITLPSDFSEAVNRLNRIIADPSFKFLSKFNIESK